MSPKAPGKVESEVIGHTIETCDEGNCEARMDPVVKCVVIVGIFEETEVRSLE